MKRLELQLSPEIAFDKNALAAFIQKKVGPAGRYRLAKRSIDARARKIVVRVVVELLEAGDDLENIDNHKRKLSVDSGKRVVIVGAGPAGLFAAIKLLENGIKPIICERGKDIDSRKKDINHLYDQHKIDPNSNYCFGEGGAGAFSDGKLYTRSTKRGSVRRILEILTLHGADEEIFYDSHPHIGSDILPKIIKSIRKSIIKAGGEIQFNSCATDFIMKHSVIKGVVCEKGDEYMADAVILAVGHSARDIYELLKKKDIEIERKPFALGVRVEHPQDLIDRLRYHGASRGDYLPAASYSVVKQIEHDGVNRGVYSFCMCPGGVIVPASTGSEEIVVNGMSNSKRNSDFANAGVVVELQADDIEEYKKYGEFAFLKFQMDMEKKAYELSGGGLVAPAQKLLDFTQNKYSKTLNETSYAPGLISVDMKKLFPENIFTRLQRAFVEFDKSLKGYLTNDAQVVGVESRTSSPIRIPRDRDSLQHIRIKRLYPCGEGAGYAGGIISSAIDGERCAEAIVKMLE